MNDKVIILVEKTGTGYSAHVDGYSAHVDGKPIATTGKDSVEVVENIKEAIGMYILVEEPDLVNPREKDLEFHLVMTADQFREML